MNNNHSKLIAGGLVVAGALGLIAYSAPVQADANYWNLGGSNFSQDWSDTSLITTDDNWSGVPSIEGYRGDNGAQVTAADPQTVLIPLMDVLDVNANKTDPLTFFTGGTAEFELADPTIALTGSGTADSPFILIYVSTTGRQGVTLSYNVRDIEAGVDNAVQQVALQYRVGSAGNFTNVPAAYIADATTGGTAIQVTPISASLAAWDNLPQLQLRVMTTNAAGNDEWVGIDNILITSSAIVPEPGAFVGLGTGLIGLTGLMSNRKKQ